MLLQRARRTSHCLGSRGMRVQALHRPRMQSRLRRGEEGTVSIMANHAPKLQPRSRGRDNLTIGARTACKAREAAARRPVASSLTRMALAPTPGRSVEPAKPNAVGDGALGASAIRGRGLLASGGEWGRPRQATRAILTRRRSGGNAASGGPAARDSVAREERSAVGVLAGRRRGAASRPKSRQ